MTGATVWVIFNLFLTRGQLWRLETWLQHVGYVLQFALIHVIMLKLQLPAALPLHAEQIFDNIWFLRDQTHIFIGWNRYCPFMVVVFNIDIICVGLQEFSATVPNH